MIRVLFSLFSGVAIALALFWAMHYMISRDQQSLKQTDNLRITEFVRYKRETKVQSKNHVVPEKPKPKERPKQPKLQIQSAKVSKPALPTMDMPNLDIPLSSRRFSGSVLTGLQVGTGKISTNIIPLFRVPPTYPRRAARRRIQGWVKVEFTITKEGTVKTPVVVASKPSAIFNSAALKAIKRWKFKPHIIAGEAYEQQAVQTLEFKLSR